MKLPIIKATIEVDCAIVMVLHKLALGYSNRHITNIYCVGRSIAWKYTFILIKVLINCILISLVILKMKDWYQLKHTLRI